MDPITPDPSQQTDATTDEAVASGAGTVEEVEAFWRNRVSMKDKAHAAERKALRDQLASYQQGATSGTGQQGGADVSAAEIERLRREIAVKDVLYERKVKYPNLVANGVSDALIVAADEGELAKFNTLFDDNQPRGTFIAPTAPRRSAPTAPKPLREMNKDELKNVLKQQVEREAAQRRGY